MAIGNSGYGDSVQVGFDTTTVRGGEGRQSEHMKADKFDTGKHYLEVVSLDVWESKDGDDFLKVVLFDPRSGKLTESFGKLGKRTMWKLERAIRGIFGRLLPMAEVQSAGGRMPVETRTNALGVFVEVEIKNSDYEGQDVLIVGDGPFQSPSDLVGKTMYDSKTHIATGVWPTNGADLLAKRGGAKAQTKRETASADW